MVGRLLAVGAEAAQRIARLRGIVRRLAVAGGWKNGAAKGRRFVRPRADQGGPGVSARRGKGGTPIAARVRFPAQFFT
jgi:hypothetical protein